MQKDMLIIPDSNQLRLRGFSPGNEILRTAAQMLTQGIENWLDSICADPADVPPPAG